jgi:hypothetical protein
VKTSKTVFWNGRIWHYTNNLHKFQSLHIFSQEKQPTIYLDLDTLRTNLWNTNKLYYKHISSVEFTIHEQLCEKMFLIRLEMEWRNDARIYTGIQSLVGLIPCTAGCINGEIHPLKICIQHRVSPIFGTSYLLPRWHFHKDYNT